MAADRITTTAGREGFPHKMWQGQLVSDRTVVATDTPFGRGMIDIGDGEMQVPDRADTLGNGATSGEAAAFVGILLGHFNPKPDYIESGEVATPVVATPVGRDDEDFVDISQNPVAAIMEVGFINAIPEEAVVAGDIVTLRITGADEATGKVLGGFAKTIEADVRLELTGLYWGAASDALGENHIIMNKEFKDETLHLELS